MMFRPQGTPADQKPSNIFAEITPGQKCERTSTSTPVFVTPANARNQAGTHHFEYYVPCLFRIDPSMTYLWIL
jgi:hypothetical protein